MKIFNRITDTKITLFDDSDPFDDNEISTDDDYTVITVFARGQAEYYNFPVVIPTLLFPLPFGPQSTQSTIELEHVARCTIIILPSRAFRTRCLTS